MNKNLRQKLLVIFLVFILFLSIVTFISYDEFMIYINSIIIEKNKSKHKYEPRKDVIDLMLNGINVWVYYNPIKTRKTIIYMHGSRGDMVTNRYIFDLLTCFDANVVTFDYPGVGKSLGKFNVSEVTNKSMEIVNYVKENFPQDSISIWGHSLGSIIALNICKKIRIESLVYISGPDSLDSYIDLGIIYNYLLKLFIYTKDLNIDMENTKCDKIVILHTFSDETFNFKSAINNWNRLTKDNALSHPNLYRNLPYVKFDDDNMLIILEGKHTNMKLDKNTLESLLDFLDIKYEDNKMEKCMQIIDKINNTDYD